MARGLVVPITFAGPAGRIEALWKEPEATPRGAAVVAHADPLQGGHMHFKVVYRLARALSRAGYGVLRFNFRGVGASQGAHDGGRGERDDFAAALDESERRGGRPLAAAGFSFGSVIALSVGSREPRVEALVGAGVPLARWKFRDVADVAKPALLISGTRDSFSDPEELRREAARRFSNARIETIEGADHFFTGRLDEFEESLAAFLASTAVAERA